MTTQEAERYLKEHGHDSEVIANLSVVPCPFSQVNYFISQRIVRAMMGEALTEFMFLVAPEPGKPGRRMIVPLDEEVICGRLAAQLEEILPHRWIVEASDKWGPLSYSMIPPAAAFPSMVFIRPS